MWKFFVLLFLLLAGGVVLAPIFVIIGPDSMPGDFPIKLGAQTYTIPLLYSLCASAGLGLLYWFMKR